MTEELIIDENNFSEYFFDTRKYGPKKGQVIARFAASADFIDGPTKRDIIEILQHSPHAQTAAQLMRKIAGATEKDSRLVPAQMARDLLNGMSAEEVAQKPYRFVYEIFFWTMPYCVPKDDPHWTIISLLNLEEFVDKKNQKIRIESKKEYGN